MLAAGRRSPRIYLQAVQYPRRRAGHLRRRHLRRGGRDHRLRGQKIQLEKDRLPDGRDCARADSGSGPRQMGQLLQSGGLRAADYRRRIAVFPLRRVHRFTAEVVSGDVLL